MLNITMEIRGLENVRTDRGGIVLLNHQSSLDLLGMYMCDDGRIVTPLMTMYNILSEGVMFPILLNWLIISSRI